MLRIAMAIALGFSVVTLAGLTGTAAEDKEEKKAKEVKLEGKLVCGKCKLDITDACSNYLLVKDGDKEIKYFLKDKGKKESYHKCAGEQAATVTGKLVKEKDGDNVKLIITDAKVKKAE